MFLRLALPYRHCSRVLPGHRRFLLAAFVSPHEVEAGARPRGAGSPVLELHPALAALTHRPLDTPPARKVAVLGSDGPWEPEDEHTTFLSTAS